MRSRVAPTWAMVSASPWRSGGIAQRQWLTRRWPRSPKIMDCYRMSGGIDCLFASRCRYRGRRLLQAADRRIELSDVISMFAMEEIKSTRAVNCLVHLASGRPARRARSRRQGETMNTGAVWPKISYMPGRNRRPQGLARRCRADRPGDGGSHQARECQCRSLGALPPAGSRHVCRGGRLGVGRRSRPRLSKRGITGICQLDARWPSIDGRSPPASPTAGSRRHQRAAMPSDVAAGHGPYRRAVNAACVERRPMCSINSRPTSKAGTRQVTDLKAILPEESYVDPLRPRRSTCSTP